MARNQFFEYYNRGREVDRFSRCEIEFWRTKDILTRQITDEGAQILDMGGGAGYYSFWLAEKGHQVHLRDLVPLHIEQAREEEEKGGIRLASAEVGDALNIDFPDETFDYVLLMGPLYHLPDYADRQRALKEAGRVLKVGGKIFAVCIPRTASFVDGFHLNFLADDIFKEMVKETLETGEHNERRGVHFTHAYFHRPEEFKQEIEEAGLLFRELYNIEGINKTIVNFAEMIQNEEYLNFYMQMMRRIELEPSLMGVASHLLAVVEK